jgi:outer membrane protein assembly factor BamB
MTLIAILLVLMAGNTGAQPLALSAPNASAISPSDWPMYGHDPQHTGHNADESTIDASNVGRLRRAWQAYTGVNTVGTGSFSAPTVVSDTVYIGSSVATGDNFFAFDVETGALRWSAFIGFNPDECFGVHIGSTAAVSGTVLVVGGGDGAYYGLSTVDGSQLWRDPLDVGPSGFAWTSPLLANGRAYVGVASNCDNPSVRGEVRALDLLSGERLASAYIVPEGKAGGGVWNSATLSPDGSKIVVVTGEDYAGYKGPLNRAIVVLDSITLEVLGSDRQGDPNLDQDWATTPVIFPDTGGRTLVGATHKNGTFYAYDLDNVSAGPVWEWEAGSMVGMPPAYDPTFGAGGTLIFLLYGRLIYIDPSTGQARGYSAPVGSALNGIAVANRLAYLNSGGTLVIVEEATGDVLRRIEPPLQRLALSGPSVSNGTVFWSSGAYLNAWRLGPSITPLPTSEPGVTPVPPPCPYQYFTDVCPGDYYYGAVHILNLDGIISGYETVPPCWNSLWVPCFRPYAGATRGQVAKIVSLAAGFNEPIAGQQFEDVPIGSTFHEYTGRLHSRGVVSGYPCGGESEPCAPPANLPYFRTGNNVTRGQISKIVASAFGWSEPVIGQPFQDVPPDSTFYEYIGRLYGRGIISGYPCGSSGEPCGPGNLPYFRPGSNVTRGQTARVVHDARTQQAPTTTPTAASTPTAEAKPKGTPTPGVRR